MRGSEELKCDLLVIGSGGAGAEAAIAAHKAGVDTLVADRGVFGRSGTTITAGHTCCAALGPDDSPELHFEDIIKGGYYLNNQRLVDIYVRAAPDIVRELDGFGGGRIFRKVNGEFHLINAPGGHTRVRAVHYGFMTGPRIMYGLRKEMNRLKIRRRQNLLITSLLSDDGKIVGATGLDLIDGQLVAIKAKAVIVGTGGFGQIWRFTTTPIEAAGDVHGMAYSAGAEFIDMEFTQFLPAQIDPRISHINPTLANFPGWRPKIREYGKFANTLGEDIMPRYDTIRKWYTTRDIRSYAIYCEVKAGRGTPRGGVLMDLRSVPKEVIENEFLRFTGREEPGSYLPKLQKEGIDLSVTPIEVGVKAHFNMGGIRIDERCSTNINGLFAAGEATGGVHGANRLGGNALTHVLVFGKMAGQSAAEYCRAQAEPKMSAGQLTDEKNRLNGYLKSKPASKSPVELRKKLQDAMWENVGVVRNEKGLKKALQVVEELREQAQNKMAVGCGAQAYNLEWLEAAMLPRQLDLAELVMRACLTRTESRGAHQRDDCPAKDDSKWLKNITLKKGAGGIEVKVIPAETTKMKPEGI